MVANFTELHKNVHDGEEIGVDEGVFCLVVVDVFVIE
jgi:hypothetical protein